jgi:ribokinase
MMAERGRTQRLRGGQRKTEAEKKWVGRAIQRWSGGRRTVWPMDAAGEQRRVCVVGSLNMDLVVRAPRFPAAGETILGGEFATFPGGKGANQAVAAARMGAKVSMVGRVGDDAYGVELRRVLEAEGVDTSGVLTTPGTPTGVAVITVAEGGGNTIVVAPGANGKVTPADVDAAREKIEGAEVLLMQLEVPLETVYGAAALARGACRTVMLNAAPAVALPDRLHALIDVLVMNETEMRILEAGMAASAPWASMRATARSIGTDQPAGDLDRLRSRPIAESMIITFGERGSVWMSRHATEYIDAVRVIPVDTVGAGDAFCGALAATWPASASSDERHELCLRSLRIASAAGSLATTKAGAIPSLPSYASVRALLEHPAS